MPMSEGKGEMDRQAAAVIAAAKYVVKLLPAGVEVIR